MGSAALGSVVGLALLLGGCWKARKPLPRAADAGPAVELIERRPAGTTAEPAPPAGFSEEREPNDDRDHAQPIDAGKGVRGAVTPPTAGAAGKGDDDWYSYLVQAAPSATGAGPQELRLSLSGGPSADLSLELMDGDGHRLAVIDDRQKGEPEEVAGLVLNLGQTIYLRVRPSTRMAGRAEWPGEDANYRLVVTQAAAPAGSEVEPNDTPETATPVVAGDLVGAVSWKKDEDWFALPLGAGGDGGTGAPRGAILRLEVTTPGAVPSLRVQAEVAGQVRRLADVKAAGTEELTLRNIGLPEGAQRVLFGVRAVPGRVTAERAAADRRYGIRASVEPALDGAETEPNDGCERANPLAGDIAGFLWPGDVDCFRVAVSGPSVVTLALRLPGDECQADLVEGGGAGGGGAAGGAGGAGGAAPAGKGRREAQKGVSELVLRRSADVLVQVVQKGRKSCFAGPYRLQAQVQPDPGGSPP